MPKPRLTIGLVVRNGAQHLRAAATSLLEQTFRDFELVVYDNASTDDTPRIAADLAAGDRRVRVVRHPTNIGALGNLIVAAEEVRTPLFCWAAHDDVREPTFLASLVRLLDEHPSAGLACCAMRHMDPNGTPGSIRADTFSLRTSNGMTVTERLCMYLKDAPGTPFYGVFRTSAAQASLDVLRRDGLLDGVPLLGIDMLYLADVTRRNDLAVTDEPLMFFRHGGWSHRRDVYGTLPVYLRHVRGLIRGLRRASTDSSSTPLDRVRLSLARTRCLTRYFLAGPMRRMTWHYVAEAMPPLRAFESWIAARIEPALRRLRQRVAELPQGSHVAIFGAGKHTRRRLEAIRMAIGARARIVAIFDDAPSASVTSIEGIPVLASSALATQRPDVLLVSSDTYEAAMLDRARSLAPAVAVWALYDVALESTDAARSSASIDATNASSRSSPSLSAGAAGAGKASMNATR